MNLDTQSHDLLRLAFDLSPAGMLVVDEAGAILLVNREIERLFGYSRGELIGKTVELLVPGRAHAHHAGFRARYGSDPSTRPMGAGRDLFGRRKDGTEVPVEIGLNPIRTEQGLLVLGTVVDITARRAVEAQLSHSERLASVGILAAGVAHEINNPLASILASVEAIGRMLKRGEDGTQSRAEALEILGLAEREIARCRSITDRLVLLAQPYSTAPTWVDLSRAVDETGSLLRHQLVKQGVTWVSDLDPVLPEIWARESGVRGVCLNLMMNAVQAMPSGGTLRAATSRSNGFAELVIEDSGPGIPPEHMSRIWDPFFTTKPPGQGTGLGLFVTHNIVTLNHGTIHAENVPSGGARFVVRWPLSAKESEVGS